jgi:hypothetical protein
MLAVICASLADAAAADDWKPYRYPQEGFALELPAPPATRELPPSPQRVRGVQRTAQDDAGTEYMSQATLYQPGTRMRYSADMLLGAAVGGLVKSGQCTLRETRDVPGLGELAREVVLDKCGEGNTARARFILKGDWLYLVLAIGRPGIEANAATARLLGSFTIIGN